MSRDLQLYVTAQPGLEGLLRAELTALGAAPGEDAREGIAVTGDWATVRTLNLELGLASRVLVHVDGFHARSLGELARKTGQIRWGAVLDPATPLLVHARARKSRLYHTGAIEQRVREGIAAALGGAPPAAPGADDPPGDPAVADPPIVRARIEHDRCTLLLDTSGPPLHRRGYRLATAKAPLREDLARALVIASGWDPRTPLLDPFCGAGTIAIEAALLARDRAPGLQRSFAFERLRPHDPAAWSVQRAAAAERSDTCAPATVVASDRDRGAVRAAAANAERAGVRGAVHLVQCAMGAAPFLADPGSAPPAGAVVCNPPFGARVRGTGDLRALYQQFGKRLARLPQGWRIGVLTARTGPRLPLGDRGHVGFRVVHGGLPVAARTYRPPGSTNRNR